MANFIFRNNRAAVERGMDRAIDIGMQAVAAHGEAVAKREVTHLVYDQPESPYYVRTGNLRNSLSHAYVKEEKAAYIGTNIYYAPYVEYGTVRMAPRPFLRNACQNHSQEYRTILEEAIKTISD